MQGRIEANGTGRVVEDSGGAMAWQSCTPQLTECSPLGIGREMTVPTGLRGVVFVAESSSAKGITPEWRGRVTNSAPPSVAGEARAGSAVTPIPGRWTGGWQGEESRMQLAACTDPGGTTCTAVTGLDVFRMCAPADSFVLPAWSAGEFLRVAEMRVGTEVAEALRAVSGPGGEAIYAPNRVTAVAMVGEILPALGTVEGDCGPTIAPRAWISSSGIASVECNAGCTAALVATRAGRRRRLTRAVSGSDGLRIRPLEMNLSPTDLRVLGEGRARLTVFVAGQPLARRTVRLN